MFHAKVLRAKLLREIVNFISSVGGAATAVGLLQCVL